MAEQPRNLANPVAAQKLIQVAHIAYLQNPGNCSGAVRYVITQLVDPKFPSLLANGMMSYFANRTNGWKQVAGYIEASNLANQGKVVVAGLVELGKHGHVLIVLPGSWKHSGGYIAHGKMLPQGALYPPSMSTAWTTRATALARCRQRWR
jgi:hypothetical protein